MRDFLTWINFVAGMNKDFVGHTIIVTGAGQGIGFEICRQLCRQGAAVVLNDVNTELARHAADEIAKDGSRCMPHSGDVAEPAYLQLLVNDTVKAFGKLDAVVANAGVTLYGEFLTYPEADFQTVLRTNLGGSFFLAQVAARQLIKQKSGGCILLMSSVTGHQAHKNLAAYGMTKAALEMLAKHLVLELSPYRIRVNALAPGATLTERTLSDESFARTWSDITPLGRAATSEDIAHAALFLLSEKAAHITGQSLIIDGGWTSVSPSPY